jgi:hypothetical protein
MKLRYTLPALRVFYMRLAHHGNASVLTDDGEEPSRFTLVIFYMVGVILNFLFLWYMLLVEGREFFSPYERDELNDLAFTAKRK